MLTSRTLVLIAVTVYFGAGVAAGVEFQPTIEAAREKEAAAGAYYAVWGHPPGYRQVYPWAAFLVAYALLAILSVLYTRSGPRSARQALKNDA